MVTQSASFGDTTEDAVLVDPPPGNYIAHMVNYDQVTVRPVDDWTNGEVSFRSPTARGEQTSRRRGTSPARTSEGEVRATRQVVVDRGGVAHVGNACAGK